MEATPRPPDARPRRLALIVIGLVLLRWWLGTLPGYPHDLGAYKRWAMTAGLQGVSTVYDNPRTTFDYPPLYAYLLAPFGRLYATVAPSATRQFTETGGFGDSAFLSLLVKIPPLAFDALIAFLLGTLAWRFGMWPGRSGRGWWPALLYLLLPPVLFNSGYWGQPDSVHTFSILLALTLILVGKPGWGWVSAALGCLMKPLAVPFLPLLALATLVRSGWRGIGLGALSALATALAVYLPFLATGRGGLALSRLVHDVGLMAFTSSNAHNLWWLLGPWKPSNRAWLGPLTPDALGLGAFAVLYALLLWRIWRLERARLAERAPIGRGIEALATQHHWFVAGAAVAFGFFMLSTHMHENHLFTVLPFLVLLAGSGRAWLWLALGVALTAVVNMAIHDWYLAQDVWSKIGGVSGYYHIDFQRNLSNLEYWVANLNAALGVALFVWFAALAWRAMGDREAGRSRPLGS
jgi:hypothetical protein